jgi:DHA1 family multidrug resistance protein-like MFS transporter
MATALAPREETGRAVGGIQSAQILSAAFGPLAGGFLAGAIGIRWTFVVTSGLCALAWALLFGLYEEGPAPGAAQGPAPPPLTALLALPRLPALLVVLFLVNFVGRSFTPILALQLGSLGVAPGRLAFSTGVLISAYSVAAAGSAAAMGRLARRFPPELLLSGSLLAGAAAVLPLAFVGSFGSFLAWAVALGLFSGGALTLCYTLGGLAVPAERRGAAFGLFSGAALFGGALSPSFAGGLAHWDFRLIYQLDALLFLGVAAAVVPWARAARGVG